MANAFHNISDAQIVDEFGDIKQKIAALEAREKELRDEIAARFRDAPLVGPRWTASVSSSTSKRLDTKKLREALGDALNGYEIESTSTRVTIKPTMVGHLAAE